jgi:membrane protein YqaA with SNARE-associated domain
VRFWPPPFSSEAVLVALASMDGYDVGILLIVAATGNTLGALLNWALGCFCLRWKDHKWFPVSSVRLEQATTWFNRYGIWSLLLAWVPIVGDPLTLVAGALRVNVWIFLVLVAIGKTARYAAIIGLFEMLFR